MRRNECRPVWAIVSATLIIAACERSPAPISYRLQWVKQAQFAGQIVADAKGFFSDVGLSVRLLPAGPDLKPHLTVAAGSDDIGIAVPNQVLLARRQGVPLLIVAQQLQGSANRYVAYKRSGLSDLRRVRGRRVGLWTGGDEAEFVAMLGSIGLTLKDVIVVPQGFTITPFLQRDYELSQVTLYNELNQILRQTSSDSLDILDPAAYRAAIPADVIITTETFAARNPETLTKLLAATARGWEYCRSHESECLDLVLASNRELEREDQRTQLRSILLLAFGGGAASKGWGSMSEAEYGTAAEVLLRSRQLDSMISISAAFDTTYLFRARQLIRPQTP